MNMITTAIFLIGAIAAQIDEHTPITVKEREDAARQIAIKTIEKMNPKEGRRIFRPKITKLKHEHAKDGYFVSVYMTLGNRGKTAAYTKCQVIDGEMEIRHLTFIQFTTPIEGDKQRRKDIEKLWNTVEKWVSVNDSKNANRIASQWNESSKLFSKTRYVESMSSNEFRYIFGCNEMEKLYFTIFNPKFD